MIDINHIYNMDCLEGMREIPDKTINLILTDLPFGTTQNPWDAPIPFAPMWEQICRIKKENAAIIFFGSGMFTADLMVSNKKLYRYNLIWNKGERVSGYLNAHKMPLRSHEDILIFYEILPVYNPQFTRGNPTHKRKFSDKNVVNNYGDHNQVRTDESLGNQKYPKSVLKFAPPHPKIHPTEKPVELIECLIQTYSNEGDIVLDFCIGSGTTAEACVRTGRNFIGFEKERSYFEGAETRIKKAQEQGKILTWF